MKKIFLTLGAVLAFGMAQAQTNPAKTQPAKTVPSTETEVVQENKKEMTVKQDAVTKQQPPAGVDATQPRKDQIITTDHVKSTSTTTTADKKPATKVARKKATTKTTTTKE